MKEKETGVVLDDNVSYDLKELCKVCKVKDDLVFDMINEGMLTPLGDSPKSWKFSATSIKKIQVAVRLQEDLGVNLPGAALALDLMEELEILRAKIGGERE
ncbi:chaperone modulator CbpM [Desulfopila aestuarii]|uniref:Chaperone modulatory protein CbpM n=1 Tax=Desulfopila aestuarii DSM 18488 TaxID=1121416 RepID=A0A1M7Y3P4_9BACT|nr:chaperone modulator CbpM [Desulfopila aestuarii]SHO46826.1 chaperone modulatory protein CbpM [Desulfopila aestuarii DSM 18488]